MRRVDIGDWLHGLGLERYSGAFRDGDIDLDVLPDLTDADLKELGVSLGDRKRLLKAARLSQQHDHGQTHPGTALEKGRELLEEQSVERRQLTVMFVDLVGSTALATQLDPEDMREVLRAYQNTVSGEIVRVGGRVAKLMGDGVLAYFGWPRAQEDDAERAVRAGLTITEAVARLATPAEGPLAARVGIATGLVVVGELVGEGTAQEETVVGETPNLAARLQGAVSPGTVVVAEGTRRLLGEIFELEPIGPLRLKGFTSPVEGFRALGERPAGSRYEARRAGRPLPMIGREQELALVLEHWRRAEKGVGQAVLLVGEAGVGKSRLVRAALDAIEGEAHVAIRYQCSPHHTGSVLWPVIRELAVTAGLASTEADAVKLEKLAALLRQGGEGSDDTVALIATLLGIDPGVGHPLPELTAQQRRARTLAALVERILALACHQPVLIVVEDTHWLDPTTLELLGQVLDRTTDARVLMLITSRPDNQPALDGRPHLTRLALDRLGRDASEAIVAGLAGSRVLSPDLLGEITARTDGVPLFVEELTKAVLEAGTTEAAAAVPASLHATLMARLDRVPGGKEVAQAAACLGREFAYPLLEAVALMSGPELRAGLNQLVAAELVFARHEQPDASYTFKHALVRDAAYESLLKSRRQELHARIARVLEERFPKTAETEPELLAGHLAKAGQAEQAARHWLRAAELAIGRSANLEAIAHCAQAETQLQTLPPSVERERAELAVEFARGVAVRAGQGYATPEAERTYSRACELCESLGDRMGLVYALRGLFAVYVTRSQWPDAVRVATKLGAIVEGLGDPAALAVRGFALGATHLFTGKPAAALRWFEEGIRHCREADRQARAKAQGDGTVTSMSSHSPKGQAPMGHWRDGVMTELGPPCSQMLGHSSFALLQLGRFGEARQGIRASLAWARTQGHPATLAFALRAACRFSEFSRTDPDLEDWAGELSTLAAEHHLPHWAAVGRVLRGRDLLRRGLPPAAAEAEIEAGLTALRVSGSRLNLGDYLALLAQTRAATGNLQGALAALDEALVHTAHSGERWYDAELHRARAAILRRVGRDGEAATSLSLATEIARSQGALLWELRSKCDLAQLWRDQGRFSHARDLLGPVYGLFTESLDAPDLIAAKELLDTL